MKIKIEVTQKDIDRGTPCAALGCPIARAAQRLLSKNFDASVGVSVITIHNRLQRDESSTYNLPKKARKFVERFDQLEEDLKPFKFALNVKPSYLKKSVRK